MRSVHGKAANLGRRGAPLPVFWGVSAVVVLVAALVAGGVVLATRPAAAPAPRPVDPGGRLRRRLRARTGQSVPDPAAGPARHAVLQGPSPWPIPSLVAHALGLTMTVRPTNCHLAGDQLAISGAVADAATTPPGTVSARSRRSRPGTSATSSRRPTWRAPPGWCSCRTGRRHRLHRVPRVRAGPRPRVRHRTRVELRRQRRGHIRGGGRLVPRPRQPGPRH